MIWTIDPERITERIFGGPHFIAFEPMGNSLMRHHRSGKLYDLREVSRAWMESRNAQPVDEVKE